MRKLFVLMFLPFGLSAQTNAVLTNFPSLTIPASARGWAMGNTGIASSQENQALSYNVARSAFNQNFHQAAAYYMPWLPGVSNDTRFMHLDYAASLNTSAFGVAINYLDLGTVALRDDNGATLGLYKSSEYNIGGSYALQLNERASIGATMRFFGTRIPAGMAKNTYGVVGDLGYCQSMDLGSASKVLSWGVTLSNLGGNAGLPTAAAVGIGYTQHAENNDRWMFTLDANRLLRDDWKGLRISSGVEYSFDEQFFLRGGVSLENVNKGNRKFLSLGAGYKGFVSDQSWGLDVFYLVPFGVQGGASPFQNSYGLTLSLNIGNFQ